MGGFVAETGPPSPWAFYWDAKDRHPDTLILLRVGDSWEALDDDAKLIAQVVNVFLLKLDDKARTSITGSLMERAVAKLMQAGHKVALLGPTANPALKEKNPDTEAC